MSKPARPQTNVSHFALSTAHIFWKLCNDRHSVRQLGFTASELAKDLTDAHGLKASVKHQPCHTKPPHRLITIDLPAKDCVELFATGRDLNDTLALLSQLMRCLEATSSGLQWLVLRRTDELTDSILDISSTRP